MFQTLLHVYNAYYGPQVLVFLAAVLAVMVGYNIFIEKQDDVQVLLVSLKTLVAFLSQATVCALLGHGLIEVPRYYWSRRNTETWLDKTYSELVRLQMNQESARKELKEKMRLLSHYNINVRQQMDSEFGALIDMTMQTVPPGLNIEVPQTSILIFVKSFSVIFCPASRRRRDPRDGIQRQRPQC